MPRGIRTAITFVALGSVALNASAARAQTCPRELAGAWTGTLPAQELFEIGLSVLRTGTDRLEAIVRSAAGSDTVPVWEDRAHLRFQSRTLPIAFDGVLAADSGRIGGFVQHASTLIRVGLLEQPGPGPRSWTTDWSPLGVGEQDLRFDLYIGDDGAGGLGGYFFFRDQRLPGLWGYGLECRDGTIRLGEKNLDLRFVTRLAETNDALEGSVDGLGGSFPMSFARMPDDRVPAQPDAPEAPARKSSVATYVEHAPESLDDGWTTAEPSAVGIDASLVGILVQTIVEGDLDFTHSVLIVRHGKLAVEEYFYDFDRDTWHDMRSASKTVASTLVGLAIGEGRIQSVDETALSFFPHYRRLDNWDPRKGRITIRDLLTMSSGLDANDSDRRSVASEGAYQSQTTQPDWIKLALDAPMIADPGSQPLYGGANPLIVGGILANTVGEPVEWFAHRTLLEPLGIRHYRWVLDPTGTVYMGGGMYMRPRDMAKYGQLYLDGGLWNGRRVLSEEWVRESWDRYGRLAPLDRNGHMYGYLWWHHEYQVGDQTIRTLEARGNGGQYIFVAPTLDLVVVINSGNFRNGRTRQPEEILRRYILPAVVSHSEDNE